MNSKPVGVPVWITIASLVTVMSVLSAVLPANAQSPVPTQMPLPIKDVPPEMVISGVLPDLPEGYMIVEGDIQIRKEEFVRRYLAREGTNNPESPSGGYEVQFWPNSVVPYEFDANVSANNQTLMQQAMALWQAVSKVQFTQCPSNSCTGTFVHIKSSAVNNSSVGLQGGQQIINIVNWNSQAKMAHELGHALGLEHEQSRPDRFVFVLINYNNVCKAIDASCTGGFCFDKNNNRIDCDFAFDIAPNALAYGQYDFDSVMHYGRNAFSRNGNDTITVLPPNDVLWQNAIGQRTHLSESDLNVMGCMYPRNEWRWVRTSSLLPVGTCRSPYATIASGVNNTPIGGMLWIEPGSYAAAGTYDKPMTMRAPNGPVTLQ